MNSTDLFHAGFAGLFMLSSARTRAVSPENPDGRKGAGATAQVSDPTNPASHAASVLGEGWKVRPWVPMPAGETVTMMDVDGPGIIRHIWVTVPPLTYRNCILRIYWDFEETPSVEVPIGDFFGLCHGLRYDLNSIPVCVNPDGGLNAYWPMPFRKHVRITLENQHSANIDGLYFTITYDEMQVLENSAYFHAQWRRSITARDYPEHVILDRVCGRGHYVGTVLGWCQMSNGWWGEGEVKFYIDGDQKYPTICTTGTEDYFGGAWCFGDRTYSTPYLGYPLCRQEAKEIPRHGLYRWHIQDSVKFEQDLKVTVQALGWYPNEKFQPLTDDISSVAYWYQMEPHNPFPAFPALEQRFAR